MGNERERGSDRQMAESQIIELQNVRVLLEEARGQAGNLSEYRRRRLEAPIRAALREVDAQLHDHPGAVVFEVAPDSTGYTLYIGDLAYPQQGEVARVDV